MLTRIANHQSHERAVRRARRWARTNARVRVYRKTASYALI